MSQRPAVFDSSSLLWTESCPLASYVEALTLIHVLMLLGGEPLRGGQV